MADPKLTPPELTKRETPVDAGSQALSEALRSSFAIVKVVMVVLMFVFLGSGFFTVGPQERALILRLGKPVGQGERALLGPGLHWSFPYPIDEYVKVSISGIQKAASTVGWYAITPEQELAGIEPYAGGSLNPAVDGYALTADGNIVHARVTLSYHIQDPIRFVFGLVNAGSAVQNALDNALLFTAARYKVDDILIWDIIGFSEAVRKRATELVTAQDLGIVIEQCSVQTIPPRQLKEAFAGVVKAEQTRNKVLNEARSYESQVLSRARAEAQGRVNAAESERAVLVQNISGEARQFEDLLPKYKQNPELFTQQRLNETLGRVLTNVQEKIYLTQGIEEFRMLINREPQKVKSEESK